MEKIILLILTKYQVFVYGVIAGGVLNYFEIQAGNIKFNLIKFLSSALVFGFLAEFAKLVIEAGFIKTRYPNDSSVIVLSIMIATALYLFIPYIMKPENRGGFIEALLGKFGFTKVKNDKNI